MAQVGDPLNPALVERFSRQMIAQGFGADAQRLLLQASVLVIGCGGLGCPVGMYLAAAGVGRIGLVDDDAVEESNLHRQVAHSADLVGTNKAVSLQRRLSELKSPAVLEAHQVRFTAATGLELARQYDVLVDCTDNPGSRYLISDAAVLADKPLVSGAALGMDGQCSVYHYRGGPCYRCLHPRAPAAVSCADGGVLGPVVGVIGSLQAMETIKVITGVGEPLSGRLFIFDGLDCRTRIVKMRQQPKPTCAACGTPDHRTISSLAQSEAFLACEAVATHEGAPAPAAGATAAGAAAIAAEGGADTNLPSWSSVVDEACGRGARAVTLVTGATAVPTPPAAFEVGVDVLEAWHTSSQARQRAAGAAGAASVDSEVLIPPQGFAAGRTGAAEPGGREAVADWLGPGRCIVLDVRVPTQQSVGALPGSIGVPLSALERAARVARRGVEGAEASDRAARAAVEELIAGAAAAQAACPTTPPKWQPCTLPSNGGGVVLCLCRRGRKSLTAAKLLARLGISSVSVRGGLSEWGPEYHSSCWPNY